VSSYIALIQKIKFPIIHAPPAGNIQPGVASDPRHANGRGNLDGMSNSFCRPASRFDSGLSQLPLFVGGWIDAEALNESCDEYILK
jgi:hypothetical protein